MTHDDYVARLQSSGVPRLDWDEPVPDNPEHIESVDVWKCPCPHCTQVAWDDLPDATPLTLDQYRAFRFPNLWGHNG